MNPIAFSASLSSPVCLVLVLAPIPASAQPADLILHHARLVTVDPAFSIHAAMAVRDGQVLKVGSDEEILKLRGLETEVRDLGGRMVLPGLLDSQSHPASASTTEFDHPIPTMESIQDVLDDVTQRGRELPEGQWIEVRQVFTH